MPAAALTGNFLQRALFSFAVPNIGRALVLRDRLLGRVGGASSVNAALRRSIRHSRSLLDAVLVQPEGCSDAVLVICHGIGETFEHWTAAQNLLACQGVASLVFNYSGYGRSKGVFSAEQCEQDTLAAVSWLRTALPGTPLSLLGFSLGTGVATAVAELVRPDSLILCDGYTSLREAAGSLGLPRVLTRLVPHVWRVEETVAKLQMPVLIVHGEQDRLFPVQMALALATACGTRGGLALIPEMAHSDLHAHPREEHWNVVVAWLREKTGLRAGHLPAQRLD